MNKRGGIFSLIGFIIMMQLIFGIFDDNSSFDFSIVFGLFIAFGVIGNIFRNKKGKQENNRRPNVRTSSQNIYSSTSKQQHECEYCGHLNDKGREYCENCGARQLDN